MIREKLVRFHAKFTNKLNEKENELSRVDNSFNEIQTLMLEMKEKGENSSKIRSCR
jgi:hypothetical protein